MRIDNEVVIENDLIKVVRFILSLTEEERTALNSNPRNQHTDDVVTESKLSFKDAIENYVGEVGHAHYSGDPDLAGRADFARIVIVDKTTIGL